MYDELIKRLREADEKSMCGECGLNLHTGATKKGVLFAEAADAIEELAAFKAHITDGHFYCMRDGVLYEAKVALPKGKVFQLPPIVFVEEGET